MGKEHGTGMVFEASEFIPQLISSIIIFLIGLFFLFINIGSTIHYFTYVETEAEIVDIKYDKESEWYIPVYEYNFNGQIVRSDGIGGRDKEAYVIGDRHTINYNPKNYEQFDEGSRKDTWILWLICLIALFVSGSVLCRFIKTVKVLKSTIHNSQFMIENRDDTTIDDGE